MKKLLIAVSFMIILYSLVIAPSTSFACSCIQPPSPQEELERKNAVFSGRVIDMVDTKSNSFLKSSADPIKVVFEVKKTWKGIDKTQAIIYTARDSASCGFNFSLGKDYIVYAYGEDGNLMTGLCDRTNSLDNAEEDLEALGEGTKPINVVDLTENDSYSSYFVYGGLLTILALILLLILIRVRNKK